MNQSLEKWLEEREITPQEAGFTPDSSSFELPLFPVVGEEDLEKMISFILGEKNSGVDWLASIRLSARELSDKAAVERVYRQRLELKALSLPKLAANHHKSIFYFLDLEQTAADYRASGLELPSELPPGEGIIKRINDSMFRARVSGNRVLAEKYEKQAFSMLREGMIETLKSEPLSPFRNVMEDQILWGRSPVRLDLAGGWTDTPPYCIMEGGKVVNLSVE